MSVTRIERRKKLLLVEVTTERLDAAAAPVFKAALEGATTDRPRQVIVDVSRVAFLDSTGLGVFVNLLKMMGAEGVLAVAGAQAAVRRLLSITQLDRVFRLFDTVEEAEATLGG